MRKIFLFLAIFLIGFVTAEQMICIDFDAPSAPSNLILSGDGNSINLNWDAATDTPNCSGISHYDIYRSTDETNFIFLSETEDTELTNGNLEYGTYSYMIHAWDLAGHNEGTGISATITLSEETGNGGNPGGNTGGGGSSIADDSEWECREWSECTNGTQERICEDILRNAVNRTETRECSPDFLASEQGNNIFSIGDNEIQDTGFITGAVTGVTNFAKTGKGKIIFVFAGLIAITGMGVIVVNRRKSKKD
jgi:LPXTG-motif cell wall-anchored protein